MWLEMEHWCLRFCILEMGINPSPASVSLSEQWTVLSSDTPCFQEGSKVRPYH